MGILDKWRNKNETQKGNDYRRKQTQFDVLSQLDSQFHIFITQLELKGKVTHHDGTITNLMIARIMKYRENDTIFIDESDYVAFELPEGCEPIQEIMEAIAFYYERQKQIQQSSKNQYYLGRLSQTSQGYILNRKSETVEKFVTNMIEREELARRTQKEKNMAISETAKQEKEKQFRQQIQEEADKYAEKLQRVKEERKKSPKFVSVGVIEHDGKLYENYDGVDLITGDILRLRKVDKIGKDGSGTYLYSAYLSKTENEYDVEFLDDSTGYPVCFEMSKRLSDIDSKNTQELFSILTMFSDPRNFENQEQLTYIGEFDKKGQINRNKQSSSNAIRLKIQSMQKEYETLRQQRLKAQQGWQK